MKKQFEYKLHRLQYEGGRSREEQVVEAVNGFAADGWRFHSMKVDRSLRTFWETWRGGVVLFLERECE